MPFQVSPGVSVSEIDLSTVVPAVSSTEGAFAGVFRWGPVDTRVLVDSEIALVSRFGKPTNFNPETFFTAANFLSYGNKLYVSRAANTTDATGVTGVLSAYANVGSVTSNSHLLVKNMDHFNDPDAATDRQSETNVRYIAKYPGAMGNSLKVSVCDTSTAFFSNTDIVGGNANLSSNGQLTGVVMTSGSSSATIKIANSSTGTLTEASARVTELAALLSVNDLLVIGNSTIGTQYLKITSKGSVTTNATHAYVTVTTAQKYTLSDFGNHVVANVATTTAGYVKRHWEYALNIDSAPGTSSFTTKFGNSSAVDEVHLVVEDDKGIFTGVPGTILEAYQGLSRASNAKTEDGVTNYIVDVINQNSNYIYYNADRVAGYTNTAVNMTSLSNNTPLSLSFVNGSDGADESTIPVTSLIDAYNNFASAEDVDVSLILQGKARGAANDQQLANHIIDNICESRKDCVAFISPSRMDVVQNTGRDEYSDIIDFRNSISSTSYAVLDSGYKYQYDKYNDLYRFIPLNGDVAGLCVRTDDTRDPWFSPAGFNRGVIKNCTKLAYNPNKAERDQLYKNGINPVVTFPGQGTVLFGDKTLLAKPSAFDRINVRRLFIVLEKAIATAAKFTLFEFNDPFTRAQFKNLVEPFLRDVQGRRGIYDFKVVCDETNNTGDVIDRNEFVGDIYIKPAKSINFIQLNFVAVRTGVEFSEVVGQF